MQFEDTTTISDDCHNILKTDWVASRNISFPKPVPSTIFSHKILLGFASSQLKQFPRGNYAMNRVSDQIKSGARAFLITEYNYLFVFVVAIVLLLFVLNASKPLEGIRYSVSFFLGAVLSAVSGWGGMVAATDANVRTATAAENNGLGAALKVAFTGGSVASFGVVGLGISGLSVVLFALTLGHTNYTETEILILASDSLAGFGFGASSIALFNRVAGGIYTKAADVGEWIVSSFKLYRRANGFSSIVLFLACRVGYSFWRLIYFFSISGADLVGKFEMDIPEDDARNPAVIADNVGDNVGDVAGMSADLYESFVGSIIAAVALANGDIGTPLKSLCLQKTFLCLNIRTLILFLIFFATSNLVLVMLPIWVAGIGIVGSIAGYYVVGAKEGASQKDLLFALHKGFFVASMTIVALSALVIHFFFVGRTVEGWSVYACIVIGIFAGALIGQITEYFTSYSYWPTQSIAKAGVTGPGTVLIQGLGIGMISTVFPALVIILTILACNELFSSYGIAMASVGMLSTLGFTLSTDAYGAIADNAGGIAEMAKMNGRVRKITDSLDALGNTTAATGKGFAIGSAVLTSLSLLAAFKHKAGLEEVEIGNAVVLSGVLVGAMLPFLFAGLTMLSVQKVSAKYERIEF